MKRHIQSACLFGFFFLIFAACTRASIAGTNLYYESVKELDRPAYAPIEHRKYFQDERYQFGYNPQYEPNIVTFDNLNVPYIRTPQGEVMTLANERWVRFDFTRFVSNAIPDWDGTFSTGPFTSEHVVFDKDGDAYMVLRLEHRGKNPRSVLLHSSDKCRSWTVYELPDSRRAGLEHQEMNNDINGPPVLSLLDNMVLTLIFPEKTPAGKLSFDNQVIVTRHSFSGGPVMHSGGANHVFTKGDNTWVVWASSEKEGTEPGTAQYITCCSRKSGKIIGEKYLGHNGFLEPDNHNLPALTMDSDGYIHVILGSHHEPFLYMRSIDPGSIEAFTKPVPVGYEKRKMGEGNYTYIGLVCDASDNLHVAARWAGLGYKMRLTYLRKKKGGTWELNRDLVIPFKKEYSVWYHKLNVDRFGRLLLNYRYYGQYYSSDGWKAYAKRYPEEKVELPEDLDEWVNGWRYEKVRHHDPCLLISDDSGDSWRLATSYDLISSVIKERKADPSLKQELTNSINMKFRLIPPGDFMMGSSSGDPDETPVHRVTISKPFYMGIHEVRVRDYEAFVGATGYKTRAERTDPKYWHSWASGEFDKFWKKTGEHKGLVSWRTPMFKQGPDYPVTMIVQEDAVAFADWLSKKEGKKYRLPTEAEWEYACRAGTRGRYSFEGDSSSLALYGWYKKNSSDGTRPVMQLKPNPWRLYDMHGNVWEYTSDYYGPYSPVAQIDPKGSPDPEQLYVIRGGSWIDDRFGYKDGSNLRSSARYHIYFPQLYVNWVGFRLVLEP